MARNRRSSEQRRKPPRASKRQPSLPPPDETTAKNPVATNPASTEVPSEGPSAPGGAGEAEALPQPDDDVQFPGDGLYVVGVGASAGGLEPLSLFFEHVPAGCGAAFVVIQHLSPDFKSLMKELLSRHTTMTVHRVEDGMSLEANSVYLIPPKKNMVIKDGRLRLLEQNVEPGHGPNYPIDLFLESLANEFGERAIGIVLSGTGTDGSRGLRAINENGGLVMVQDPETAQFDGMPRSAIAMGPVHYVLPPDELARSVYGYVNNVLQAPGLTMSRAKLIGEKNISRIVMILKRTDGLDFSCYKASTLARRIERRIMIGEYPSLDAYVQELERSEEERHALRKDLLISVTRFFRDPQAWELLKAEAVNPLVQHGPTDEPLRVWVTACATGEEVYSLAILIQEAMEAYGKVFDVKIFATDIDSAALERAAAGTYPESIAADVGFERLKRFFVKREGVYQVGRNLREMVIFAPHDVTRDAPFTRMHMVLCRNVLIYMQPELQTQVLSMLHFALRVKGILFLGAAETTGELENEFRTLEQKWRIYEKRRDVRLPLGRQRRISGRIDLTPTPTAISTPLDARTDTLVTEAFGAFLSERQAVCLLVGPDNEVTHVFGAAARYLRVPQGKRTAEVTRIVPKELNVPLSTALHRVRKQNKPVTYSGVKLADGGNVTFVDMRVDAHPGDKVPHGTVMVMIEPAALLKSADEREYVDMPSEAAQRVADLEHELQHNRENLQAAIEELETTNEEQQATNEELLASNEELQSTNEELHSVNEELHTVNAEYQAKIQELTELNNDMDNLLRSTEIGTVFLDKDLRIREFTPAVRDVINLIEQDIGRPIEHISHNLHDPQVMHLIRQVLDGGEPVRREVQNTAGTWLLMRIDPYRTDRGQREGVVLTFVDISELRQAQEMLRQFRIALDNSADGVFIIDRATMALMDVNAQACQSLGYSRDELLAMGPEGFTPRISRDQLEKEYDRILHDAQCTGILRTVHHRKDGSEFPVEVSIRGLQSDDRWLMVASARDITERQQAEEAMRHANEALAQVAAIVDSSDDAIMGKDLDGIITSWNRGAAVLYGYASEEAVGRHMSMLLPPDVDDEVPSMIRSVCEGSTVEAIETRRQTKSGRIVDVTLRISPIRDHAGEVIGVSSISRDITERKQAQEQLRRLATVVRDSNDAVTLQAFDGQILAWNHGAEQTYGYAEAEALQMNITQVVPEDLRDEVLSMSRRVAQGKRVDSFETKRRTKDGRIIDVWLTATPILNEEGSPQAIATTERDVTERNRIQAELIQLSRRNELILRAVGEGIVGLDAEGRITFVNPTGAEMVGYRPEELVGRFHHETLHYAKEDQQPYPAQECPIFLTLRDGMAYQGDDEVFWRADGTPFPAEYTSTPVREDDGSIVGAVVSYRDATERKLAERVIQDSERRFRAMIEQAAVGIAQVAINGKWLRVNQKLCDILGYSQEELVHLDFQQITHSDDVAEDIAFQERMLAGELDTYAVQKRHIRKDGEIIWINLTVSVVRDDRRRPQYFISVIEDITDRRRAEEALRESEAQHRGIFESASEGFLIVDGDGVIVEANPAACSMHAYTYEEMIGKPAEELFDPGSRPTLAALQKTLGQGLAFFAEAVNLRKDGATFYVEIHGSRFPFKGASYQLAVLRDITERKRAEEDQARLNAQLEKAARELEIRNRELERANTEVEAFVYSASHDLRSPLINLQGFTNRLEKRIATLRETLAPENGDGERALQTARDVINHDVDQTIARINNSVDKFGAIIDALLNLSRTGRQELAISRLDMKQLCEKAVATFDRTIEEQGATVVIGELADAMGDISAVDRVVSNLVSNALKYLDPDRPGRIEIGYAGAEDGRARYFVRDNGVGIDPRHHEKVFKIFHRLKPNDAPGEGIGLAFVKKIVERHGGRIDIESEPGKGASFYFTLEAVAEPAETSDRGEQP